MFVRPVPAPAPPVTHLLGHRRAGDRAFVLLSGRGDPELSSWSYAGLTPSGVVDRPHQLPFRERPAGAPPFFGGAVGYVGYDVGWALQPRPRTPRADPLGMPGSRFHVYDTIYARNEITKEGVIVGDANEIAHLEAALSKPGIEPTGRLFEPLTPSIDRATHEVRIDEALRLIRDGEIYQVNLTYPLEGRFDGDPAAAFIRLTTDAPPFAAYLDVADGQSIVSASPECFLDFDPTTRRLRSFPIKGTIARDERPDDDHLARDVLRQNPKERAEHLMIVDLIRNDIGRLAEIGTVHVDGLAYVETFPTVHHLTSRVVGTLPAEVTSEQIERALFPGGSITGAPKLRAMSIIDRLENAPRGVYTGAIGFVAFDGRMRTNIAIRTAQIADGHVRFGVGGGIVHDSVPGAEWRETQLKALALTAALQG